MLLKLAIVYSRSTLYRYSSTSVHLSCTCVTRVLVPTYCHARTRIGIAILQHHSELRSTANWDPLGIGIRGELGSTRRVGIHGACPFRAGAMVDKADKHAEATAAVAHRKKQPSSLARIGQVCVATWSASSIPCSFSACVCVCVRCVCMCVCARSTFRRAR